VRPFTVLVAVSAVLFGVGTGLVADSPYDPNVVSERNPFAPERPATFNGTTATSYLIDYEETRLYNDLVRSRGHTFDRGDDVRAACTGLSATRTATDQFRVRLRCHGEIEDVYRLIQPTEFTYTVTYSVNETTQKQISIRGYPYSARDELRQRPHSAE
jgi:hypothetical protein